MGLKARVTQVGSGGTRIWTRSPHPEACVSSLTSEEDPLLPDTFSWKPHRRPLPRLPSDHLSPAGSCPRSGDSGPFHPHCVRFNFLISGNDGTMSTPSAQAKTFPLPEVPFPHGHDLLPHPLGSVSPVWPGSFCFKSGVMGAQTDLGFLSNTQSWATYCLWALVNSVTNGGQRCPPTVC